MHQKVKAIYQKGTFVLQEPCDVPENSEVEIIIQGPPVLPPELIDPKERVRILKAVVERMQQNPIPAGASRLTREALHEHR